MKFSNFRNIIFSLIFSQILLTGMSAQDCSFCQKQLLQKVNQIEQIGEKLDIMEKNEKLLIEELSGLKKKGVNNIIKEDGIRIDQLKKENTKIKKNLSQTNIALAKSNADVKEHKKSLDKLNKILDDLNEKIRIQSKKNSELQEVIDCVKEFERQSKLSEPEVTFELENARNNFEEYKRLLLIKSKDEPKKARLISSVINKYESYKGKEKEMDCGGIKLSFFQDFLTVKDYNNIAEIYGRNLGNSISQLDSSNQINESNRRVLDAAGVIMEKGNYDARSEIANKLSKYINKERRPGSANSELKSNFQKIISAYQNESYLEAITLYDSYEKFITLESMQQQKGLLDEVEYCIGNILLWDLGSYGNYINGIIQGNWVKEYQSIKQCGNAKLNLLILDKTANLDLRKKAAITINKYYE